MNAKRSAGHLQPLKDAAAICRCAVSYWIADNASATGAALAFYCAFSLAPLLIILVTIAGWFVGQSAAYGQIRVQLASLFGPATARVLIDAAKSSQHAHGTFAAILSVATLLIGATTVLSALQTALERILECDALVRKSGVLSWVRTRFLSLGFILALGFLLLVSLTVSTALSSMRGRFAQHFEAWVTAIGVLDRAMSVLLVATLFALLYRYLPRRRLSWRVVFAGGLLTALLFEAGRWGVSLYLAHSTEPSAFGAAASFVALLLWLYYSALIFLFGAELTGCLGEVHAEKRSAGPPRRHGRPGARRSSTGTPARADQKATARE